MQPEPRSTSEARDPNAVIPALVAGIHPSATSEQAETWIPGMKPGMTLDESASEGPTLSWLAPGGSSKRKGPVVQALSESIVA